MNIIYSEKKLGLSIEIKLKGPWKIFKSTMKKEERRMKKEEIKQPINYIVSLKVLKI